MNLFADTAADTIGAIGSLGPTALILVPLAFGLAVVAIFVGGAVIALVGIPRFKIPGLAWSISGVWQELHGFRLDLRAWQRGEELPELPPISDSVPLPRAAQSAKSAPKSSRDERQPGPQSTRRR